MSDENEFIPKNPRNLRACVTLTPKEYRKIKLMQIRTGKSIPELLREAYRKGGMAQPTLPPTDQAAVIRELKETGAILNEAVKQANSGNLDDIESTIQETKNRLRTLMSFCGLPVTPKPEPKE